MKGLILTEIDTLFTDNRYNLDNIVDPLRNDVSTDEIYPVRFCFYFKNIGRYALTGDRFGKITKNLIQKKKVKFIVTGSNFGCGSAREHAAITFKEAGIKLIYANSFNKVFRDNCTNNGIFTTTYLIHLKKYFFSKKIPKQEILKEFKNAEKGKFLKKNFFTFTNSRIRRQEKSFVKKVSPRPMTISEKIIAKHLKNKFVVKPNSQFYAPCDLRFTYEIFAPMIKNLFEKEKVSFKKIKDPGSIYFFEDHFVLSEKSAIGKLIKEQRDFAKKISSYVYRFRQKNSGICHSILLQNLIMPGQIVVGTDSHTSTGGAVNALCLPVGTTEMASIFLTKKISIKVSETVRINLKGWPDKNIMAKDIILYFFSLDEVKSGLVQGTILEFGGKGLLNLSTEEMSVLTNMSTESGAQTGIIEPNQRLIKFLEKSRQVFGREIRKNLVYPDKDAEYKSVIEIDLSKIKPMLAIPASPLNVVPLGDYKKKVKINKAFIGSCTGGKLEDLKMAAKILENKKVKKGIELVIHPSSVWIMEEAERLGIMEVLRKSGAKICQPACGACCGEGPGRVGLGEVVISSSNRNYKGRMGPGKAYLASPITVASSALSGFIVSS